MRTIKLFLFAYLVASFFCFGYTFFSWASLASNQTVSWDNANDAVSNAIFSARSTAPTGLKQITKSEALSYYWVDPYNATLYNKTSSQLVVKQDLTPGDVLSSSASTYYSSQSGHMCYGWSSPCSISGGISVTAYYHAPLIVGTKLYGDVNYGRLLPDVPSTTDWFSVGGTPVKLDVYASYPVFYTYVTAIGSCITGSIGAYLSKQIQIVLSTAAPCSDGIYMTGSYTDHTDGLTHTWHMTYNITSGLTTQTPQTPISDFTLSGLVTGDVIDVIDGGTPWAVTICSGNVSFNLTNSLP